MKFASKFSESNNFSLIRFFLVVYFSFFIFHFSFAQFPGTWVAIYGGTNYDRGRGIAQTFDKGYIVSGTTSSYGIGNTNVYLLKIDSAGKYQWQNTFGGININNGYSVKQTQDSGFIISGYTNSFGNGGYDMFLVKTDSVGHLQWQKTYGGSDWDLGYWAEQTSDGGYILCGQTYSYGNNSQMYLVKTNSNGDTLWTKKFGGTNDEAAYEVHQTLDNGYILAGYTTSFGAGNSDFYLVKTNSNGDTLWTKTYGGTADDSCTSVALCKDKGFLLGGSTQSNRTQKIYFLRTDSVGNVKDSNAVSPVGKGNNYISRIRETKDLNYITLVNSGMGILLYKWTRGTGFGSWSSWGQSFGLVNDQAGYDLQQTSDSGFVLVGYTASIGIGPDNIFIAKTNKLGDYNDTANSYVAVNEISEKDTSALIYPNPFSENLFLKIHNSFFADEKEFSFEVSDICGRGIMKTTKNVSPSFSEPIEIQIPSEKFKPGFYLASLQSGNKKIYRKLLFVK